MAFRDINPQGPVHFLVIPKDKDGLNRLSSAREEHKALLVSVAFSLIWFTSQNSFLTGTSPLHCSKGCS